MKEKESLREDLILLKKRLHKNEEEIKSLPRGTLFIRKMNGKEYVYRSKKVNGKVIQEYLGPLDNESTKTEMAKSLAYKRKRMIIMETKREIQKLSGKESKENPDSVVNFLIGMSTVDSKAPSPQAKKLLKLLVEEVIDYETYKFAIERMYVKQSN